jgi:DNA-binding MltR family transcriptional regulator
MWKTLYQERLADWYNLRQAANALELEQQLKLINDWWFRAPIVNRVVTWDDPTRWPSPWDLLVNNGYCDLARALGIVYTLLLLDRQLYTDLEIISTGQDNLVQIDHGKYILNWAPGEVLNINSTPFTVLQRINSIDLASFLQ